MSALDLTPKKVQNNYEEEIGELWHQVNEKLSSARNSLTLALSSDVRGIKASKIGFKALASEEKLLEKASSVIHSSEVYTFFDILSKSQDVNKINSLMVSRYLNRFIGLCDFVVKKSSRNLDTLISEGDTYNKEKMLVLSSLNSSFSLLSEIELILDKLLPLVEEKYSDLYKKKTLLGRIKSMMKGVKEEKLKIKELVRFFKSREEREEYNDLGKFVNSLRKDGISRNLIDICNTNKNTFLRIKREGLSSSNIDNLLRSFNDMKNNVESVANYFYNNKLSIAMHPQGVFKLGKDVIRTIIKKVKTL